MYRMLDDKLGAPRCANFGCANIISPGFKHSCSLAPKSGNFGCLECFSCCCCCCCVSFSSPSPSSPSPSPSWMWLASCWHHGLFGSVATLHNRCSSMPFNRPFSNIKECIVSCDLGNTVKLPQ